MALIDDLKQQRLEIAERQDRAMADVTYFAGRLADLTRAIAALQPEPITNEWHDDYVAEQETAREQLEREPEIEPVPSDEQDDASEFAFDDGAQEMLEESYAPGHSDADLPTLTGDPAIEPESELHEEAVERTATKLFNEHWGRTEESDGSLWPLSRQHPGIQEAWREKARELLAAPTPAVMEMANEIIEEAPALNSHMQDEREQPVQTEPDGYAPVTNPEADTIARAHEYYSPEKMGDRNRSLFDIFRHKREDA